MTTPGQKAVASFSGKASGRVVFSWGKNTVNGWTNVTLLSPTGTQVASTGYSGDNGVSDVLTLPANGTYELQLDPDGLLVGSVVITMTVVPPDAQLRLQPGVPVKVTISAVGQRAIASFSGKAGQSAVLDFAGNTLSSWTTVTLLTSRGASAGGTGFSSDSGTTDPMKLPATGRYTLQIDPDGASTGSVTLTLRFAPAVG
jgi:hypothetical protein